jgi:hypothetical protein
VRVHDLSVPGNLSRVSWKLSRTVLRGGTSRKVGPLLGQRTGKTKQPYCCEVDDVRVRWNMGPLEGRKRQRGRDLFDSDDNPKRGDLTHPRSYAGHPNMHLVCTY